MPRTLVHISDLHVGRDAATDAAVAELCCELAKMDVDEVLLTGDVTHRGRRAELALFRRVAAPIEHKLVVVPGNHDRLGDDVAQELMPPGRRVAVGTRPGLVVVRVDSTAPHNRRLIDSHGLLTHSDLQEIDRAIARVDRGAFVILMLHHHLHPLAAENMGERLAMLLRWPQASELSLGHVLLRRLRGRCDLVLHGHRHASGELLLARASERPLHVLNAGSTPELRRARMITHEGGRAVAQRWIDLTSGAAVAFAA